MKKNKFTLLIMSMAILFLAACDEEDNDITNERVSGSYSYVVVATSGENDYLIQTEDISSDTELDATASDAVQATGDRIWYFYGEDVAYGFLYNQTDAGTTASYVVNESNLLEQRNEIGLDVSVHTRGEVNGTLILAYSDRLRDTEAAQNAYFFGVNAFTDATISEQIIVTDDLLEEGEAGYLTDIAEYEGYMIAGARSVSSSSFSSDYYNNTYVVVFNDDYTVNQVIKDSGRTGFVAGMKYSQGETGLEVVDNGDLYVFSSAQTNYTDAETVTVPSGVLKINQGDFEFDSNYFFDISAASGGYNLFRTYYISGTTFLVQMYPGTNFDATFGVDANKFGVVDVASESFTWVTGFPEASGVTELDEEGNEVSVDPFYIGRPYIDKTDELLLVPVTTSDDEHYVYTIDPASTIATQGAQIQAEGIKAIGVLSNE